MGYTHYWYQKKDFDAKQWEQITNVALELCNSMEGRKTLGIEKKQSDYVRINNQSVSFNGKQKYNLDHETFCLERHVHFDQYDDPKGEGAFNFCKTAQKPYDKFVTAMLIAVNTLAPDVMSKITSDGWDDDWQEGRYLLNKTVSIFKYGSRVAVLPPALEPRPKSEPSKMLEALQSMGKVEIYDERS